MARTDDRDLVFVSPFNGSPLFYGFNTNLDVADRDALGHVKVENITAPGVFGANRPKPARMSKSRQSGTTSSYVDWNKIRSAEDQDWKITRPAKLGPVAGESLRSTLVGVEAVNGVDYCWNIAKSQLDRLANDRTALGIRVITQAKADKACTGVQKWYNVTSQPKGAKSTDDKGSLSVKYVAHNANLPSSWSKDDDNVVSDPTVAVGAQS